ncbi:MAG TPA: NAD(P)-dependent oxidoreductase [Stellaceae bacterium]|nr:NAD(P)-dependent oxidoreductase [Stellaceae bacterium]
MNLLILGSAGQIGSALVNYVSHRGHNATGFDIADCPEEDLRDTNSRLEAAIAAADFVYHLAFDVGGSAYLTKFQESFSFIHNNVRIMANSFQLLERYRKPFVFASSQMSNMTFSNYGLLKAIGERYTTALGGLTVKFWNVYGIERNPEKTHVITDFLTMARVSRRIAMRTRGTEMRQFLYAEDCSEALLGLAHRYAEIPRTQQLHLTSFAWSSIREVAEIIAGMFAGTEIVPGRTSDTVQKDQRNEPDAYILRYWQPKTNLSEGIAKIARQT